MSRALISSALAVDPRRQVGPWASTVTDAESAIVSMEISTGRVVRSPACDRRCEGTQPNIPFAWGAQPHNGLIYFNDVHTGIWVTKLVDSSERAHILARSAAVDHSQDVDASRLRADVDRGNDGQGSEVEDLDRTWFRGDPLDGDERVAIIR